MSCEKTTTEAQRLVLENMGYLRMRVRQHLKAYGNWGMFDDVLHEAVAGACKAAQTYREGAGAKFTTWCNLEVDAAIHRAMRHLPHVIVPPRLGHDTQAYANGERGYREPLRAVAPASIEAAAGGRMEHNDLPHTAKASPRVLALVREATTTHGEDAVRWLDASRVARNASAGISRHLPGHRDKERRVDVFLRVFFGELQSDIAEELGVSRQSISAMVARVQPAFEAWCAEVRSEAA